MRRTVSADLTTKAGYRETSPGVFEWDENFWLELNCQGTEGHVVGAYYQGGEPGCSPVTEDYEIETGI